MEIIKEENFKGTYKGKTTALYTLKNKNGLIAQITNYGAIIVSIYAPDRNGKLADIVQGYDSIEQYTSGNAIYMGAVCGRCANRIANGTFSLEGKTYKLATNNNTNHLHGGLIGFDKVVWDVLSTTVNQVVLQYISKDGEEGYPGNATIKVTYTLTDNNELKLDYYATTDKATVVNLASHSYFNLAGEGSGSALNHELKINARFFTPVSEASSPTGEIRSVAGTPMDFQKPKAIGTHIHANDDQIKFGAGYDHNWVINKPANEIGLAAEAYEPESGRVMEIFTTQPGVQFYSANWVENEVGKGGKKYQKNWAFCLETQHFADAINQAHFPSTVLKPGEVYQHTCIHKFSVK